jgi:hypothetical protein
MTPMPTREDPRRGSGYLGSLRFEELNDRERIMIAEEQAVQDIPRKMKAGVR